MTIGGAKNVMARKGQVGAVVGLIVGLILLLGVVVPIASSLVAAANLSGTDAIIAGFITTMVVVGALVQSARTAGLR